MSPSKPVRNIKVHVPRHNSQRLGPAVTAQVEALAREQRIRVDVRQTALEPSSALAVAIDNASEWNSLLMTARAERGPQWDIGTQQFMVDEHSELYYDPSSLLAHQKEAKENSEEEASSSAPQQPDYSLRTPSSRSRTSQNPSMPSQFSFNSPMNHASSRHPGFNAPGMSYNTMNTIPPGQFYSADSGMNSPMRMTPGVGSMGMSMHGIPDGINIDSPDMRRRITRGIGGDDGYGGMHG